MTDHQGKGPELDEGRVEKNTSRPPENKPVEEQRKQTNEQIKKAAGGK